MEGIDGGIGFCAPPMEVNLYVASTGRGNVGFDPASDAVGVANGYVFTIQISDGQQILDHQHREDDTT